MAFGTLQKELTEADDLMYLPRININESNVYEILAKCGKEEV